MTAIHRTPTRSRLHAAGDVLRTAATHLTGGTIADPVPPFPEQARRAFTAGIPGAMFPGEVTLRLRDVADELASASNTASRQTLTREALTLLGNIDAPYTGPLLLTARCLDAALHTDGIDLNQLIADEHGIDLAQMTDLDTP